MTDKKIDLVRVLCTLAKVISTLSLLVNGAIILAHAAIGAWGKSLLYLVPFAITMALTIWITHLRRQIDQDEMVLEILRHEQRARQKE